MAVIEIINANPGKINPAKQMSEEALNSLPPSLLVFSQTFSLLNVQGVLIPMNQFCRDFPIKSPTE